jgi:hypothetical protein
LIYRGSFLSYEEDIAMKSGLKWMVLAVAALVSTSAWAVWNPDTDANLIFNMNFEVYNNGAHTTTSAKPAPPNALTGTVIDYNTASPTVFGETGAAGLGFDANFALIHDIASGSGIQSDGPGPNDVKLTVPSNTGVFDLSRPTGGYLVDKRTWTFWFNVPNLDGTIIRHASAYAYLYLEDPETYNEYKNLIWEIRISGGTLQFYHKNSCLTMQTASTLSDLGVTVNTWHSAAVVIDRSSSMETIVPTTQLSTKIYVDGLEVPVVVTSLNTNNMNVDAFHNSPLWIGAGERDFDGLLDDVRLFNRVLTPLEVSILNQPDKTQPVALLPIPRSSNVVISTGVSWEPATGATVQTLYFGTDPNNLPSITSGGGGLNQATNAQLGGLLSLNTKYYWYVKSTIGGVDSDGPLWSFNSETGKALNPSPADGAGDVNLSGVDLSWTTPSTATYAVYLSKNRALVEANDTDPCVRIANGISVTYVNDVDTNSRGATYYWRVNCTYPSGTVAGDIWSFRTKPYELVFNTSGVETRYADYNIPAYTCVAHQDGWSDACATGSLASDGVVVFNFPSGFNYDRRYDIIVVPEYRATDICSPTYPNTFPTPLAIHATGNFYFDGRVQIAGDDVLITSTTSNNTFARSGGFPGPKYNQDSSVFNDRGGLGLVPDYWTSYSFPNNYHHRFGDIGVPSSAKFIFVPTALAQSVFGPGQPVSPPYKGGGGGGYGGVGGDSGRGYMFGVFSGGPSYGDKEVPVPVGGSAGGWGSTGPPGAAGGGGIEIYATGNVVFDSNSRINANGGGQLCAAVSYPSGGGSGGSVRIIAGGSVTNKGTINVNGGKGGNSSKQANECAGGGGGGRVAIFYGTACSNTGTITANGGARGTFNVTLGLAQNGQNGTIFDTNGSPKKASAPTPANGDKMVYCHPDPCTIQLKWYSGYGGTTDEVFCDTNPNPTTSRGSVSATRGQHSVSMTVSAGNTYYMKVITDGTVSSDTWSFRTVNWRCRQYDGGVTEPIDPNHVGGPEWDFNHDCVLNFVDLAGFGKDWGNVAFDTYILDVLDLDRFANEWLECYNRTDNGCAGY